MAFQAGYLLADCDLCLKILIKAKRFGEAAFFAKAYAPSRLEGVTKMWSAHLKSKDLLFQPESVPVSDSQLELESKFRELWSSERPAASEFKTVMDSYFQ